MVVLLRAYKYISELISAALNFILMAANCFVRPGQYTITTYCAFTHSGGICMQALSDTLNATNSDVFSAKLGNAENFKTDEGLKAVSAIQKITLNVPLGGRFNGITT